MALFSNNYTVNQSIYLAMCIFFLSSGVILRTIEIAPALEKKQLINLSIYQAMCILLSSGIILMALEMAPALAKTTQLINLRLSIKQ